MYLCYNLRHNIYSNMDHSNCFNSEIHGNETETLVTPTAPLNSLVMTFEAIITHNPDFLIPTEEILTATGLDTNIPDGKYLHQRLSPERDEFYLSLDEKALTPQVQADELAFQQLQTNLSQLLWDRSPLNETDINNMKGIEKICVAQLQHEPMPCPNAFQILHTIYLKNSTFLEEETRQLIEEREKLANYRNTKYFWNLPLNAAEYLATIKHPLAQLQLNTSLTELEALLSDITKEKRGNTKKNFIATLLAVSGIAISSVISKEGMNTLPINICIGLNGSFLLTNLYLRKQMNHIAGITDEKIGKIKDTIQYSKRLHL